MSAHAFDFGYVNALRQGDPDVEAHFVAHFSPILLHKLRRRVRSADQARDLRQETFLRVLSALRSDRGIQKPEQFELFVIRVCHNVLREAYREQRRSMALSDLEIEPVADLPSPYALVLAKQIRHKARRMLSRLDAHKQGILEAMFLDGQSKDEICQRLGISRGYLRVVLHRAKKRFGDRAGKDTLPIARRNRSRSVPRECNPVCASSGRHSCDLAPDANSAFPS